MLLALAAASAIIAQPPIHARLQMDMSGAYHDLRIHGIVENAGSKTLNFVEVACNVYDADGLLIDGINGYVSEHLGAHEAARFERRGDPLGKAVRFVCRIKHHPEFD